MHTVKAAETGAVEGAGSEAPSSDRDGPDQQAAAGPLPPITPPRGVPPAAGTAAAVPSPSPAGTASSPAPATPLEQRTWRREAQRSLRLALTAFKEARTKVQDANTAGVGQATQLVNQVLTARFLPRKPLGALAEVQGLKEAAVGKLLRQQRAKLQGLEQCLQDVAACTEAMRASLSSLGSCLADSSSSWQAVSPVFHTLELPAVQQLLRELLSMYQQELGVKQQLLEGFWGEHAACWLASSPGAQAAAALRFAGLGSSGAAGAITNQQGEEGGNEAGAGVTRLAQSAFSVGLQGLRTADQASGNSSSSSDEALRQCLTVAITTWMVMPRVDDERVAAVLQLLTDDMAGF